MLYDELNHVYRADGHNTENYKRYWRCINTDCNARITPKEGQKDENDDELFTIMKKVKPHTEVCDMKRNKSNVLLKNLQLI